MFELSAMLGSIKNKPPSFFETFSLVFLDMKMNFMINKGRTITIILLKILAV